MYIQVSSGCEIMRLGNSIVGAGLLWVVVVVFGRNQATGQYDDLVSFSETEFNSSV